MEKMRVRLTKKFAEEIDGVDLSHRKVGDTFRIPQEEARLLIAEQWAVPTEQPRLKPEPSKRPFLNFSVPSPLEA